MAETSTIFGFMKYVSATDILSDFKKTVDSHFVNSLKRAAYCSFFFFILSESKKNIVNVALERSTFSSLKINTS